MPHPLPNPKKSITFHQQKEKLAKRGQLGDRDLVVRTLLTQIPPLLTHHKPNKLSG